MSGEQRSRGGSHDLNFVAETILPEDTDPEAELTDAVSSIAIASVGGSKALSYTNGLVDESGDWTIISQDKAYSPSVADIGCRLRIEVSAITLKGRHLLAGPVAAHTAPVLLSPNAPPKRKLLTIPGSVTGLASAPRFRLISYNILAEQYATRQVGNVLWIFTCFINDYILYFRCTPIVILGHWHGRTVRQ